MSSNKNIDASPQLPSRRSFLKKASLATTATIAAPSLLVSCSRKEEVRKSDKPVPGIKEIKGKMSYRINPNTGDHISVLGFGSMHLPQLRKASKEAGHYVVNQEAVNRAVDYAIEHGVNFFNTAPAYCDGECEPAMGIALHRHPRSNYFIATKLSNFKPEQWSTEASIAMYRKSLADLQVDHVNMYMLHNIGTGGMTTFRKRFIDNGILDFLKNERNKHIIQNLGFSFASSDTEVFNHAMAMHDSGEIKWDVAMISLNYVDWFYPNGKENSASDPQYLYGELQRRGIPINVVDPLMGGEIGTVSKPVSDMMRKRRPDDTISSWAMRFAGSHPGVLTIVVGMAYMEHLKDHLYTCSPLIPLTDDETDFLKRISARLSQHPIINCIGCHLCMPCPYGVDIPEIFSRYNLCLNNDDIIMNPDSTPAPEYARMRRAFIIGMDCAVPKLRQADQCIGCGACLPKCPKNINIPAKMHTISEYTEFLRSHPQHTTAI